MANDKALTHPDSAPIIVTVTIGAALISSHDFSGGDGEVKDVTLTSTDKRFVDGVIYVGAKTDIVFNITGAAFTDFRWTRSVTAAELDSPPKDLGTWFSPGGSWTSDWTSYDEFEGTAPSGPSATTMTVTDRRTSGSSDHTYLFILEWTEGTKTVVSNPKYKIKQANPPPPHN